MSGMIQVPFGNTLVTRAAPLAGPEAYKTYGMSMPAETHWRPASCEEYGCEAYASGWVTTLDLSTELGRKQYHFITHDRERSHTEQRITGTLVKCLFPAGTPCFGRSEHKVPLERPARFYVAEGDFRGNPRRIPVRVHQRAEDWAEDFSGHLEGIKSLSERG
jgi:hypothetical protein